MAYWYTGESSPPSQVPQPVSSLPHDRMFCTLSISWGIGLPLRASLMFRRSASAELEPMAQQEPQYTGMCWLRMVVQ